MDRNFLKAYAFLGVPAYPYNHKDAFGDCRFCGKPRFSIHMRDGRYRCLDCEARGNLYTFMARLHLSLLNSGCPSKELHNMSRERGISHETIMDAGLVWDDEQDCWLFPIWKMVTTSDEAPRPSLVNLKKWDWVDGKRRLIGVPGQSAVLYRSPYILTATPDHTLVFLEGEWDSLALLDCQLPGEPHPFPSQKYVLTGCPGADTHCFTNNFIDLIRQAGVTNFLFLFDNDRAGRRGAWTGAKKLVDLGFPSKYIKILFWEKGTSEGYDVRDLVNSGLTPHEVLEYVGRNSA